MFAKPVMPPGRAAKQKADTVIKAVCLRVDGDAKREMSCHKIGKTAQKRDQVRSQNATILR